MKLIVDAQLPASLCNVLAELGVESVHVDELSKGDESADSEITRFADENGYTVLTKDSDFYHSYMALGKPGETVIDYHRQYQKQQTF